MKITKSQQIEKIQVTQGQQDAVSLFEKFAGRLAAPHTKTAAILYEVPF